MPTGLYSVDEVLTQIFAGDDSEADNMPSDDDRSSETSDSDNGAAAAPTESAQAHIDHGESFLRRGRGRNQARRGRGGGRGSHQNRTVIDDDGCEYSRSEEVSHKWIRDFDEPVLLNFTQ